MWYFRRIDVYSNLYNLVLKSLMLKMEPSEVPAAAPTPTEISLGTSSSSLNGGVVVNLMWDNLKLQQDRSRDPIYCVWTQSEWRKFFIDRFNAASLRFNFKAKLLCVLQLFLSILKPAEDKCFGQVKRQTKFKRICHLPPHLCCGAFTVSSLFWNSSLKF